MKKKTNKKTGTGKDNKGATKNSYKFDMDALKYAIKNFHIGAVDIVRDWDGNIILKREWFFEHTVFYCVLFHLFIFSLFLL